MDRESFYGRFSTSARSSSIAERESSQDRFSTSNKSSGGTPGIIQGPSWELLVMLLLAFDLVFGLVLPFVVEPMHVPSDSMSPTLQVGDRVLTNKLAYDFLPPQQGDLVVFENVEAANGEAIVKRAVGLPGDEVSMENGVLLVNGAVQDDSYLEHPNRDSFDPVTVPQDHVFVMGDNRANSYDSRFFGPVPNENLLGEASFRVWPLSRLGVP